MTIDFMAMSGSFLLSAGHLKKWLSLAETETLLLKIRDALLKAQAEALEIAPAPETTAANAEIDALRRDIQRIARNEQDMAQAVRDLYDRVKAIETGLASRPAMGPAPGLAIPTRDGDRHRLDGAIAPGVEHHRV